MKWLDKFKYKTIVIAEGPQFMAYGGGPHDSTFLLQENGFGWRRVKVLSIHPECAMKFPDYGIVESEWVSERKYDNEKV